jgi:hypothetical protein
MKIGCRYPQRPVPRARVGLKSVHGTLPIAPNRSLISGSPVFMQVYRGFFVPCLPQMDRGGGRGGGDPYISDRLAQRKILI